MGHLFRFSALLRAPRDGLLVQYQSLTPYIHSCCASSHRLASRHGTSVALVQAQIESLHMAISTTTLGLLTPATPAKASKANSRSATAGDGSAAPVRSVTADRGRTKPARRGEDRPAAGGQVKSGQAAATAGRRNKKALAVAATQNPAILAEMLDLPVASAEQTGPAIQDMTFQAVMARHVASQHATINKAHVGSQTASDDGRSYTSHIGLVVRTRENGLQPLADDAGALAQPSHPRPAPLAPRTVAEAIIATRPGLTAVTAQQARPDAPTLPTSAPLGELAVAGGQAKDNHQPVLPNADAAMSVETGQARVATAATVSQALGTDPISQTDPATTAAPSALAAAPAIANAAAAAIPVEGGPAPAVALGQERSRQATTKASGPYRPDIDPVPGVDPTAQRGTAHAAAKATDATHPDATHPDATRPDATRPGAQPLNVSPDAEASHAHATFTDIAEAAGVASSMPSQPHVIQVGGVEMTFTGPIAQPGAQPAGGSRILEQVAASLAASQARGNQEVVIHLRPVELGRIRLQISSDGGKELRATLEVDNLRTFEDIQRQAPALIERLSDVGLVVKAIDVSLNTTTDGQQHADSSDSMLRDPAHAGGHHGQGQASRHGELAGPNDDDDDGAAPAFTERITDESIDVMI